MTFLPKRKDFQHLKIKVIKLYNNYKKQEKLKNNKLKGGINMLSIFKNYVKSKFREEKGQGMVEYSLLVGLIAIVVIAALVLLGPAIKDKFDQIVNALG